MKIADTISVNPSKSALGHVEPASTTIFRSRVLVEESSSNSVNFMKLLFPGSKAGYSEYRKYDVPLRTLLSTILIVTGITCITGGTMGLGVCSLVFGGILALGLLTRPVMLGAAVYYCIVGALAVRHGSPDLSMFSLMFGCLIFAVIGGGKYSCDTFIRRAIGRSKRKSIRKQRESLMGYKVFHKVKY